MSHGGKSSSDRPLRNGDTLILNDSVVAQLAEALGLPTIVPLARAVLAYASGLAVEVGIDANT